MSIFQVNLYSCVNNNAGVAELADALDLGSSAARRAGSIPVTRIRELMFSGVSSMIQAYLSTWSCRLSSVGRASH